MKSKLKRIERKRTTTMKQTKSEGKKWIWNSLQRGTHAVCISWIYESFSFSSSQSVFSALYSVTKGKEYRPRNIKTNRRIFGGYGERKSSQVFRITRYVSGFFKFFHTVLNKNLASACTLPTYLMSDICLSNVRTKEGAWLFYSKSLLIPEECSEDPLESDERDNRHVTEILTAQIL